MAQTKEYGLGEYAFPRGWFMAAESAEVTDKPLAVRYFGQEMALYRGKSGKVVLLDAYCPHMGTHLAKNTTSYVIHDGQVEGDSIRCPYHAWRFGPDGKCNQIPYYDGPIPKAAQVRSWTVEERYGIVWVWHDPEGAAPEYGLPNHPEWDDPQWVRWKVDQMGTLALHPIEVLDNMADWAHLGPVHGETVKYFENEFNGHICRQIQGGGHRTLVTATGLLETDTWYTGPGILHSRLLGLYPTIMFITNTPVDDGVIKVWHGLMVKSPNAVATEQDVVNARQYQEMSRLAFAQDFEVWANKRPCINVLQVPTDGPYHKGRLWYRQFYNPRAKAPEIHKQLDGRHSVKGMPTTPSQAVA